MPATTPLGWPLSFEEVVNACLLEWRAELLDSLALERIEAALQAAGRPPEKIRPMLRQLCDERTAAGWDAAWSLALTRLSGSNHGESYDAWLRWWLANQGCPDEDTW